VESFEIARSGRLDAVILGAYQVDETGSFANWRTPSMVGGGIGGAMDLVASPTTLIVTMEHTGSKGDLKLVRRCTYPLTAKDRVDVIVTDLALFRRVEGCFHLLAVCDGFTPEEILELTEMDVIVDSEVGMMQDRLGPSKA
jgi:3-oxoacid CoA-transferase